MRGKGYILIPVLLKNMDNTQSICRITSVGCLEKSQLSDERREKVYIRQKLEVAMKQLF